MYMNQETSQERSAELLNKIRTGERKFLRQLYEEHRQAFGVWIIKTYRCDEDMAAEVYQQAFTTLYYNVKEGKLNKLTSSLKTYVFAIGRNLIRDHFKLSTRRQEIMEVAVDTGSIDNSIIDRYEQSALKETVKVLLEKIGEPCKTVLELFYLKGYALDAIAVEMNYKSEHIAAKRKFICLKQMRELLNENRLNGEIKSP
jgi:RNA polymerase sigma-70 factor (ECF subfamily)